MSCFNRSIHAPGFGRSRTQAGCAERRRYGRAHAGGDGQKHEQDDDVGLRQRETNGRAEHGRRAGSAEDGRENSLEK